MKDIFVVEGKNDVIKLRSVIPNAMVIVTNGFAINDFTINEIKTLSSSNRIVLLLDPDGPGEKIRRMINDQVENCYNVFAIKSNAISKNKKKVGIEHLDNEYLIDILKDCKPAKNYSDVTEKDLFRLKLNGSNESKEKRKILCDKLNIGYANAKTLIYKLSLFGIMLNEVEEILEKEGI